MSSFKPDVRTERLKPLWRVLMISNLALGAYLFVAQKKKIKNSKAKEAESVASTPIAREQVQQPIPAEQQPNIELRQPDYVQQTYTKVLHPSPEDKQQELYNWILEEEYKRKPKDREDS